MDIKSATQSRKSSSSDDSSSNKESDDQEDSDLDSGSEDKTVKNINEISLAERLEELKKKDELMKKMAEKYKNAATVLRDQDGKKLDIEDLQASKQKKLEELNKAMVNIH